MGKNELWVLYADQEEDYEEEDYGDVDKDAVWKEWMEAILLYGPWAPETRKWEKLYNELYIKEHGRLP